MNKKIIENNCPTSNIKNNWREMEAAYIATGKLSNKTFWRTSKVNA